MSSDQLCYNAGMRKQFRRVNQLLALFYVRAWLRASFGSDTSFNDLKVLSNMLAYWKFNYNIADATFNNLAKHQWYLPEEAALFPLFSDIPVVANLMLYKMAERIRSMQSFYEFRRKIRLLQPTLKTYLSLTDVVGPDSWF